jgi:hypothetical protein
MDVGDLSNHVKYCVSVLNLQWAIIRTSPVGIPYNKTQFIVHTGLKANTNKTQTSRFTLFPQNRVCPRRQQIVYYWRNNTNTQLNPVQSHKTQCFTLTLGVSLKYAHFHSHSCTCTHCTLALFLALFLSPFLGEMKPLVATKKYQTTANYYNKYCSWL